MRIRPATLRPLALVLAAAALGACGQGTAADTDAFDGEDKAVAEAVYEFRDAVAKRDEARVCDSHLTGALRDEIIELAKKAERGTTCAEAVQDSIRAVDATDIEIAEGGVSVTGKTATVKIKTNLTSGEDPVDTLELAEERGWRIAKLPAACPEGQATSAC